MIIDTNILIQLERETRRGTAGVATDFFKSLTETRICITPIIAGEIACGISMSGREVWEKFLLPFELLSINAETAWHYGVQYRDLAKRGELIGTNGGDCEDFALAKYFTLRELGVPDERLRLTYVRAYLPASKEMQSHMVMTYHFTPDAEPLVLDNLTNVIKLASERKDLAPTYSFNGAQLWASKLRASGRLSESPPTNLWSLLRVRLPADEHTPLITGEK